MISGDNLHALPPKDHRVALRHFTQPLQASPLLRIGNWKFVRDAVAPKLLVFLYPMKFLIGKKLNMSQIFAEDGTVIPVTYVEAGPCVVTDVRTGDKDGYQAVQIGFGQTRTVAKPQAERAKQFGPVRLTREARVASVDGVQKGDVWTVTEFSVGDSVDVTGTSKGRGFAGVVKRHGFHGHNTTHGTKDQVRKSGSVGAQGPQRVFKDMRMAGHMGDAQVTVKNLKVVSVDQEKNVLAIRGAIPGSRGGILFIRANATGSVWN